MVKHILWVHYRRVASHQVMGLSNIKALCGVLSSKMENASGKTILALNLFRSTLYFGIFGRINSQLCIHVKERILVRSGCVNRVLGVKLRIQPHIYWNKLYMYILHSPWTSKAKGAAVHICDCCHYPQELPLLRSPHIYMYIYNVIYIKFHSQLWNQQQNKQTKACNAKISVASLFSEEILLRCWTTFDHLQPFQLTFYYSHVSFIMQQMVSPVADFFFFRFTKLQWIVIWP